MLFFLQNLCSIMNKDNLLVRRLSQ